MSRLVLALSLAGLAAGCSSGNMRLAGMPMFAASNNAEPSAMASVESSTLPPVTASAGSQLTTSASLKAKGYTLENAPIVQVGPADTAATLSTGFGVPADVILEANGLASVADVRPGQRLIIPVKASPSVIAANNAGSSVSAFGAASTGAPPTTLNQQAAEGRYVVQPGDTLWSISTAHSVSPEAVRSLNGLPPSGSVQLGQTLRIPNQQVASLGSSTATDAMPETASIAPAKTAAVEGATLQTPPAADSAPAQAPAVVASVPTTPEAQAPAPAAGASGFRWPVQGRIITGFGKQADGGRNEGINLAVPAGTPVHAAESGTVIYAGNELEGYGNLVLVQHSDDWVSAYAHNEALQVSRGDKVSRGQTIAKVGKTGSVDQPQLHFELRKKSKPVDPLPHLSSGT